jgi:hypothetical protein
MCLLPRAQARCQTIHPWHRAIHPWHGRDCSSVFTRTAWRGQPIKTTRELADRIQGELREVKGIKDRDLLLASVRRCFQAIRIEVSGPSGNEHLEGRPAQGATPDVIGPTL